MPDPHGLLLWLPWAIGIGSIVVCACVIALVAIDCWHFHRRLARPAPSSAPPDHTEGEPCRVGSDDLRTKRILREMGPVTDSELARIRMLMDLEGDEEEGSHGGE